MVAARKGTGRPIVASTHLAVPPETVFRFLDRLENHARLAPGSVEMLYLHPGPDGGAHALVRLNGPLGLQRTARTDLLRTLTGSNYVAGRAIIGTRTEAYVTWTIEGGNPGSVVTLWVNVLSTDLRDRLVLRLGGRRWLAGHFQRALELLSEELAPATVQTNGDQPQMALANQAA